MDDLIYGLAVFPVQAADASQTYLAARNSGLYLSSDLNAKWSEVCNPHETGLPPTATAIAIPPNTGDTTRYAFAGMQGGVLRTSNGGADWYFSPLSAPPPVISCIAVSPEFETDGMLIVGTLEDGIFRSENRGGVWTPSNFGLLDLRVFSLAISPHFRSDETIFAGTESGVFVSTNAGRAWRETAFSMDDGPILSLAVSPSGAIFAGTESSGLCKSEDWGKSWFRRDDNVLSGSINQLVLLNDDEHLLALHDDQILASNDGGQNWQSWQEALPSGITAFAMLDSSAKSTRLSIGFRDGQMQIIQAS